MEETSRTFLQEISEPPPFSLNALLVMVAAAILVAMQGFIVIHVPDPLMAAFEQEEWFLYSFQLPFAIFVGALLGPGMGLVSLLLFCITGLFFYPVFAAGGGTEYLMQPGMGYLLGMAAGAYVGGRMVRKAFCRPGHCGRSLWVFFSAVVGVLTAHGVGSLALLVGTVAGLHPWPEFGNLWLHLTGAPVAYDMLAAMAMFCLVRYTRLTLWPVLY
jgi:biotin transporter BioY